MKRALTSLRVQGFKAVKDSGTLKLGGLTVFIGNNGAGKRSILEALRFLADLSRGTLDQALEPFRGYEHLRWKGDTRRDRKPSRKAPGADMKARYPLTITARGHIGSTKISADTRIVSQNLQEVVFERETLTVGAHTTERASGLDLFLSLDRSILGRTSWFDGWQFLDLVPDRMGTPTPLTGSPEGVRLARDGSNLAAYLRDLRDNKDGGADAFEGLLEVLQVILPYARDLEPAINESVGCQVALHLHEGIYSVPGWMLSTGTLRLIALLALLRHPRPPSLICIEELENGLDPRATDLVVGEILRATGAGRTQVMITTHSPFLLDLVPLESLVLVAREEGGPPFFDRPGESAEVVSWADRFAPGRLYTMGILNRRRDSGAHP